MVRLMAPVLVVGTLVAGHGAMVFPRTRNYVHVHNIVTGANGPSVCGTAGGTQWPADDAEASKVQGSLTTPLTQLVAGGLVDIELFFTAPHQGHAVLELCNPTGELITEECFQRLERDPSDERMSPFVPSDPTALFFPENACVQSFVNDRPETTMKARFRVPEILAEHAVLRWQWQSGNSCSSHPANTADTVAPELANWMAVINGRSCRAPVTSMTPCGQDCPNVHSCTNEQFRNCADVTIVAGDKSVVVQRPPGETGGDAGGDAGGEAETPQPTGYPGEPIGEGLEDCLLRIRGTEPHHDEYCRERCHEYALPGGFGDAWCHAAGYTNLHTCVAAAQTACI